MTKTCIRCRLELPPSEFYTAKNRGRDGADLPDSVCKPCRRTASRDRYYSKSPERRALEARAANLKSKFGITLEQFDELLGQQGRVCAICGTDEPRGFGTWHVDHDHASGRIRGLLCFRCNAKLAHLEDVEWRVRADAYLASPPALLVFGVGS